MDVDFLYRAEVVHIVDGDTVDLNVDLGFKVWVRERFRLARIDAPERRDREAWLRSKQWLEAQLPVGSTCLVRSRRMGKYGRWLGEIWKDGRCLNDEMLELGLAKAYGK